MKPNRITLKNIIVIFIFAMIFIMITGCYPFKKLSETEYVSKELGIDFRSGTVVNSFDDHGGFLGDGTTIIKISFDDSSCVEKIKDSEEWCPLPLTENLIEFLDNVNYDEFDDVCIDSNIKNGYYCFIDRHTESRDSKDDTDLLNRFSINATLAIYDTETNALYYAELDT